MKAPHIPELVPAATLILTRPHGDGFEVYLLKRSPESRFLPGVYVFPGGILECEDHGLKEWEAHLDIDPESFEKDLGGESFSTEAALPFALAAIRETFEEAGVWLARKRGPENGDMEALLNFRAGGNLLTQWFMDTVKKGDWVLSLSRMRRWSHWITPHGMPFRYDTRFFLAKIPEDQVCSPDLKEMVAGVWVTPKEALELGLSGQMPLSPPIVATLHELQTFGSSDELMNTADHRPWGDALLPKLVPLTRGYIIVEPWDPRYHEDGLHIRNPPRESDVLPPDAPFSRIWYDGKCWRPV